MLNKRGLSQVVTTILFVMIGLVALAIVWFAIDSTILSEAKKINLNSLTLDLTIDSAKVNLSNDLVTVKVSRNPGEGDLQSIKFIVEDEENAEVYEHILEDEFLEFEQRTISFSIADGLINAKNITKISIAPVFYTSTDKIETENGRIIDSIEVGLTGSDENGDDGGDEGDDGGMEEIPCTEDENCTSLTRTTGLATCEGNNIIQDMIQGSCGIDFCIEIPLDDQVQESCDGTCVEDVNGASCVGPDTCTPENVTQDCGENSYGAPYCFSENEVYKNYTTWSCSAENLCSSDITSELNETCAAGDICIQGECVLYTECQNNDDCFDLYGIGYVCNSTSMCVPEIPTANGTINTAWPFSIGEYFDSADLPFDATAPILHNHIIFTNGLETRCLRVSDFQYFEGGNPYIRLNTAQTNISNGDSFETWETDYGCTRPVWN